jgi:hypothetical protein
VMLNEIKNVENGILDMRISFVFLYHVLLLDYFGRECGLFSDINEIKNYKQYGSILWNNRITPSDFLLKSDQTGEAAEEIMRNSEMENRVYKFKKGTKLKNIDFVNEFKRFYPHVLQ